MVAQLCGDVGFGRRQDFVLRRCFGVGSGTCGGETGRTGCSGGRGRDRRGSPPVRQHR